MLVFLFITAIAAVVFGILFAVSWYEKKRTAAIQGLAESMELDFHESDTVGLRSQFAHFNQMRVGHGQKVYNLLRGTTDEVAISIFDYTYTTGSGKSQQTHKLTITALESPRLNIPAFTLRPESFLDRFGSWLGLQDINFDHHPEFSRLFVLKGEDVDAIGRLFDKRLLDFFAARPGISVEGAPGQMLYYRSSKRIKPEEFAQLLSDAYEVFGVIVDR